jgi:glycosyltransferase involved in cell wall biosynthesis
MQKLENLYKRSHLFFLPTRAECFGIVFCEANSYGIPVISTDTGGVSSVIQNDINGYLLALSATHKDYYEEIVKLLINRNKLKEISISSREKYLRDLNWGIWGIQMKEIITATYNKSVL